MTENTPASSSAPTPNDQLRARLRLLAADPRAKLWPAAAGVLRELDQVLELVSSHESRIAALERMLAARQRLEGPECDSDP